MGSPFGWRFHRGRDYRVRRSNVQSCGERTDSRREENQDKMTRHAGLRANMAAIRFTVLDGPYLNDPSSLKLTLDQPPIKTVGSN